MESKARRSVARTVAALLAPVMASGLVIPSVAHAGGFPSPDLRDNGDLVIAGKIVDTGVQNETRAEYFTINKKQVPGKVVSSKADGSMDVCMLKTGSKTAVECIRIVAGKDNPGAQNIQNLQFSAQGGSVFWTSSNAPYGAWNDSNTTVYRVAFPTKSNPNPTVQAELNVGNFSVIPQPGVGQGGQLYAGDLYVSYADRTAGVFAPDKKAFLYRGTIAGTNAFVESGRTFPNPASKMMVAGLSTN